MKKQTRSIKIITLLIIALLAVAAWLSFSPERQLIRRINTPFQFSGKVVDQDAKPIANAKIVYRVSQPREAWDSNTVLKTIHSKADGSFHIHDHGSGFSIITFEKKGFRMIQGQLLGFSYTAGSEQAKRNDDQVRLYTLIEEKKLPSLIHQSDQLILDWDGIPVNYDLHTGKLGKTGDIIITALRGKTKNEGETGYDWSFKVEAADGGIIETTREQTFLAPEDGYKPFWEYGFLSEDPKWAHGKKGDTFLFFKLTNGNHGLLQMHFRSEPKSKVSGRVTSYLNPTGDKILGRVSEKNHKGTK